MDKKKKTVLFVTIFMVMAVILAAVIWQLAKTGKEPAGREVLRVGEEIVYLDEVNLYLYENMTGLGITAAALEQKAEDGGSGDAYYKGEILQTIMDYKVGAQVAGKRGMTLSEEEEKQVLQNVVDFLDKTDGSVLRELGIGQECITESYRQRYLANKLANATAETVSVEEQSYCTLYIMQFPKVEMDENGDYVRAGDSDMPILLSEEDMQERKQDAEAALAMLKEGEDADTVARKYGVELYSGEESNLADSFSEPFLQYAKSLKKDACSPLLETESCYAIVKMINENDAEIANQILSYYKEELIAETIAAERENWYQETGVLKEPDLTGSVWEKLTLYDFVKYVEE